jgi:hypothetical protein
LRFDAVHFQSASYGLHQRAAKTLTNLVKESYASIGTFLAKLKQNDDFMTYPKAIINTENLNEMAARKRLDGRQRELGVCVASRKGSFLNFLPMKP